MTEDFDKSIMEYFKSDGAVTPTRNLCEAAIQQVIKKKEEDVMSKNSKFKISPKRFVAVFSCVFVLSFSVAMAASPDIRNTVSEFFQNIFTVEKQGDSYQIVEKSADQDIGTFNFGLGYADQYSADELATKIGFKPVTPVTIGKNSLTTKLLGISLKGKSSKLIPLSKDTAWLTKCFNENPAFSSLKEFDPRIDLTIIYSDGTNTTNLYMSKAANGTKSDPPETVSTFDYKSIKCSYLDCASPDGQTITEDSHSDSDRTKFISHTYSDPTKMPNGIKHIKFIIFDLDGIQYQVFSSRDDDNSGYNSMVQFTKDYIDAYMSQK